MDVDGGDGTAPAAKKRVHSSKSRCVTIMKQMPSVQLPYAPSKSALLDLWLKGRRG